MQGRDAEEEYQEAKCILESKKNLFEEPGDSEKLSQAIELLRSAADKGNVGAQYQLGIAYRHGFGVYADYEQALNFFSMAAEQGSAEAEYAVGEILQSGLRTEQNLKQAVKMYKKAAKKGFIPAEYNLGVMYINGWGVLKDDKKAVNCWKKAANRGLIVAQYNLGLAYEQGTGCVQNILKSYVWYSVAVIFSLRVKGPPTSEVLEAFKEKNNIEKTLNSYQLIKFNKEIEIKIKEIIKNLESPEPMNDILDNIFFFST